MNETNVLAWIQDCDTSCHKGMDNLSL